MNKIKIWYSNNDHWCVIHTDKTALEVYDYGKRNGFVFGDDDCNVIIPYEHIFLIEKI
jgi:hypothetical protein